MQNIQATISATFRDGILFLNGHSPNLTYPGDEKSLVDYLSYLSGDGWRITWAVFEGFTLNLKLEKAAAVSFPATPVPVYLFHSFFISYFGLKSGTPPGSPAASTGSSPSFCQLDNAARDQKALSEKFNGTIRADGWQELCTSKLLRTTGYWIISLWMRELPA
jgi:hypothetical protein